MKTLKIQQREWLVDFGRRVLGHFRSTISVPSVVLRSPSSVRAFEGYTDGWYVELGYVRHDRGSGLQLWFDRWPRTPSRKLWFGYKGTRREQIRRAAAVGTTEFGRAYEIHDGAYSFDRTEKAYLLRKPLPLTYYGKPIAELYSAEWAFYGVYLRQTPDFSRSASSSLVERVAIFLERVALGVANQLQPDASGRLTTAFEGHPHYREHLVRERSTRLANEAKIRDGYTCRVCGINFEQLYGSLGRGFAEAHHIVPLGKLVKSRRNSAEDLATVCANCHRMLHRLPAASSGLFALKRRFTATWPRSS